MSRLDHNVFAILALALLSPLAAGGEVRFTPMTEQQFVQFLDELRSVDGPGIDRSVASPDSDLLLPYFQVDTNNPFGETTLFALRDQSVSVAANCNVTYRDVFGASQSTESPVVPGSGVFSRNLRDVSGLKIDPDGYKRGYVSVDCDRNVSGDALRVNPDQDFATGTRMIATDDLCVFWDIRFIAGAAFSGGTQFSMYHPSPGGIGPGDPPTAAVTVSDEAGKIYGPPIGLNTDQRTIEFDFGQVVAALPGGLGPANGSFWIAFSPAGGGGFIQAVYSAEGRYSIGMTGSCQDKAP